MIAVSDPGAAYRSRREEVDRAIARVANSGTYILGSEVAAFEREFAAYIGTPHAIAVASGTDAIECALRACGVRPGDEVYTVSHTALATVAAIVRCQAVPVLVDVDPETFTMDPNSLESALQRRSLDPTARGTPRAVVPVHLYGCPADMPAILDIAQRYGMYVVEDCAQAHGAALGGRRVGQWGNLAAFSFYPTKNLGAMGDGGMVLCGDPGLASAVESIRQYGWDDRHISTREGTNSRLDELQAAILRVHLRFLEADNGCRRAHAAVYDSLLAASRVRPPTVPAEIRHAYHQYVVRSPRRAEFQQHLHRAGIQTAVHYPVPCHLQPGYSGRVILGSPLGTTERLAEEVLSLPVHPFLSQRDVRDVAHAVCAWDDRPSVNG